MNANEYVELAMRTKNNNAKIRLAELMDSDDVNIAFLFNGCLGLSGEVGEFNDIVKKWAFHEDNIDETHLKKELGDIMWYIALICEVFHWNLEDILEMNIEKLRSRYPEGFDAARSSNRAEGDI